MLMNDIKFLALVVAGNVAVYAVLTVLYECLQ